MQRHWGWLSILLTYDVAMAECVEAKYSGIKPPDNCCYVQLHITIMGVISRNIYEI